MLFSPPDIAICPGVYPPSDDSELLLHAMVINPGERILDMGTGSGILAIAATLKGSIVSAADISEKALECTRQNAERNGVDITLIHSDLFESITGKFEVIIFNPPYLPGESWSDQRKGDRQWDGGGDGSDTVQRFISELPNHLIGRCYLLFSSLTGEGRETMERMTGKQFHTGIIAEKHLFFETLYVMEIRLRDQENTDH